MFISKIYLFLEGIIEKSGSYSIWSPVTANNSTLTNTMKIIFAMYVLNDSVFCSYWVQCSFYMFTELSFLLFMFSLFYWYFSATEKIVNSFFLLVLSIFVLYNSNLLFIVMILNGSIYHSKNTFCFKSYSSFSHTIWFIFLFTSYSTFF
jgi:hypothetical protein